MIGGAAASQWRLRFGVPYRVDGYLYATDMRLIFAVLKPAIVIPWEDKGWLEQSRSVTLRNITSVTGSQPWWSIGWSLLNVHLEDAREQFLLVPEWTPLWLDELKRLGAAVATR